MEEISNSNNNNKETTNTQRPNLMETQMLLEKLGNTDALDNIIGKNPNQKAKFVPAVKSPFPSQQPSSTKKNVTTDALDNFTNQYQEKPSKTIS